MVMVDAVVKYNIVNTDIAHSINENVDYENNRERVSEPSGNDWKRI